MSKKKICVITGSRAEYGLFFPVLKKIQQSRMLELQLVVSTMHLSTEFGMTYTQIEHDGFRIDEKIENLLAVDARSAVAKSTGLAIILISDSFNRLKPDMILLLGDRYETHAAATTAMLMNIPIAHIHGGEITEGAVDEQIRHSITKMSYLHFTSTEEYRKRIIQMGEDPLRVVNSGAPGIDNIKNIELLSKDELENDLGWKFGDKSALFTYHPVTHGRSNVLHDLDMILAALSESKLNILFTYANSDNQGRAINLRLEEFCATNKSRYTIAKSLGQLRYLSAMNHVDLLIGNTSSGIIEAASFHKPVINIGERQKGRLQSGNVIDTNVELLSNALEQALDKSFRKKCDNVNNIYGEGNAAEIIVKTLESREYAAAKRFIDIEF